MRKSVARKCEIFYFLLADGIGTVDISQAYTCLTSYGNARKKAEKMPAKNILNVLQS